MTEDEAKSKLCPFFAINPAAGTICCAASDCMMWVAEFETSIPNEFGVATKKDGNYCGLARK